MSKNSVPKLKYTTHPLFLALIFIQCLMTLYVVINQQTQIEHQALLERIQTMKEKNQTPCENLIQKMSLDKVEKNLIV